MFHYFQWGWFEALSILKRIDNNSCEKMCHVVDVSDVCTARHIHSQIFILHFSVLHPQHNTHHNRRRCAPSTVCATTARSGDIWYDMHTFTTLFASL